MAQSVCLYISKPYGGCWMHIIEQLSGPGCTFSRTTLAPPLPPDCSYHLFYDGSDKHQILHTLNILESHTATPTPLIPRKPPSNQQNKEKVDPKSGLEGQERKSSDLKGDNEASTSQRPSTGSSIEVWARMDTLFPSPGPEKIHKQRAANGAGVTAHGLCGSTAPLGPCTLPAEAG